MSIETGEVAESVPSVAPPAVILASPQLGENIGTAARAMANFGVTDLRIVTPRDGWPNERARAASSGAHHVIDNARVFDTLDELNQWLEDRCITLWAETAHQTLPGSIADVWEAEKPMLMALPPLETIAGHYQCGLVSLSFRRSCKPAG